jgi:hypothetical protein
MHWSAFCACGARAIRQEGRVHDCAHDSPLARSVARRRMRDKPQGPNATPESGRASSARSSTSCSGPGGGLLSVSCLALMPFSSSAFRWLWCSSLTAAAATGMERTATAWLALESGGGGVAVGIVLAARMLPSLLFGLASGTIADRVGERNADWIVRVSDHLTGGTAVDRCFCSQLDQHAKCELFH